MISFQLLWQDKKFGHKDPLPSMALKEQENQSLSFLFHTKGPE